MKDKKLTKKSKIRLVELPPYEFGKLGGNLSMDEFSKFRLPSRACHVMEGMLREDGWEDVKTINPLYHGNGGKLTKENFREISSADYALFSFLTRTVNQSYELAKLSKESNPNQITIFGGQHATFLPEEGLNNGADIIIKRESEKTLLNVMNRTIEDRIELEDINGISFKKGKQIIETKREKLLTE